MAVSPAGWDALQVATISGISGIGAMIGAQNAAPSRINDLHSGSQRFPAAPYGEYGEVASGRVAGRRRGAVNK
jgi:hypothetical protein